MLGFKQTYTFLPLLSYLRKDDSDVSYLNHFLHEQEELLQNSRILRAKDWRELEVYLHVLTIITAAPHTGAVNTTCARKSSHGDFSLTAAALLSE